MNILIVSNMYPEAARPVYGQFVQYQAEELHKRGHEVVVVSPQPFVPSLPGVPKRYKKLDREVPAIRDDDGILVIFPRTLSLPGTRTQPITALTSRIRSRSWIKRLEELEFDPDIVNAHVAQPNGYASIPICDHFDAPLVTTVHGADLNLLYNQFLNRLFVHRVFDQSDAILVNSPKLEKIAEGGYGETDRLHVVPVGIPVDKIQSAKTKPCPSEIDRDIPTLVSVGDLIDSKGHATTLEALSQLSQDVQCIIIGDGQKKDEFEEMARSLSLENVYFTGVIPNEHVFEYLWHSQIFVLPSYREAFGIAYLEAMACELPAIACREEGPEYFIEHGENGYLTTRQDPDELAYFINELLESPSLRRDIGKAAKETSCDYSWTQNVNQVEQIYQALVDVP